MKANNLDIIYEDNHLVIVNKKAGDIVQGDKTGDTPLSDFVKQYLKEKYNKPGNVYLGVVHRLDRPTSGIVVFARTSKAAARLSKVFREKEIQKTYWAITKNKPNPKSNRLIHYLRKNNNGNKSYAKNSPVKDHKEAILTYNTIATSDNYNLLEVKLETGRHHQIRCQLSTIGCPIKGDLKYGFSRSNPDGSICLHARRIQFTHPVSKESIDITAEPPKDNLWNALKAIITH